MMAGADWVTGGNLDDVTSALMALGYGGSCPRVNSKGHELTRACSADCMD